MLIGSPKLGPLGLLALVLMMSASSAAWSTPQFGQIPDCGFFSMICQPWVMLNADLLHPDSARIEAQKYSLASAPFMSLFSSRSASASSARFWIATQSFWRSRSRMPKTVNEGSAGFRSFEKASSCSSVTLAIRPVRKRKNGLFCMVDVFLFGDWRDCQSKSVRIFYILKMKNVKSTYKRQWRRGMRGRGIVRKSRLEPTRV